MWTKKLTAWSATQLSSAHVTKNNKKTKTNKRQCQVSLARVREAVQKQSKWNQKDYGGKDMWKRWVLNDDDDDDKMMTLSTQKTVYRDCSGSLQRLTVESSVPVTVTS